MQIFKPIDRDLALDSFDYDPQTGFLTWKVRPRWRFVSDRACKCANNVAGKRAGHVHTCTVGKRYVQVRVERALHYAHRIAWTMAHGEIPPGLQIDHINGDGTDNRLCNLRLVTVQGNKRNQRRLSTNKTGFTGVSYCKERGLYEVCASINDRTVHLGRTETAEEGYALRQAFDRENGFHENHGADRPL
jgi:hypothetical protein